MAPAVSSLTYRVPSGPGTASTGRPQRLPSGFWKPATRVIAGSSVLALAFQAIHNTAGGWGGWRFQEPWTATTAPLDHGAGSLLPSKKSSPSGAAVGGQGNLNRGQGGAVEVGTARVGQCVGGEGNVGVGARRCGQVGVGVADRANPGRGPG